MPLTLRQRRQFIRDYKSLMTDSKLAKKYKLGGFFKTGRLARKLGIPSGYKWAQLKERREMKQVEISKQLCILPNLAEIARRKGINYHALRAQANNIEVGKVGCYVRERQKCRICGKPKGKTSFRRLCDEHEKAYANKYFGNGIRIGKRRNVIQEVGKAIL